MPAKPWAEFKLITPKEARDILEHKMSRNRKVSETRRDLYGSVIKSGDWLPTSQGIAFNPEGMLIDGQHRLGGIVKADTPAIMLVAHNIPDNAQLVMDQPLVRRAHDQIRIKHGWDVMAVHIGIVKQMMLSFEPRVVYRDLANITVVDRFYQRHKKAVDFAYGVTRGKGQERGVTIAPVMAPIARAWHTQDLKRLERFGEVLITGLTTNSGESAAVLLRNYLKAGIERKLSARRHGSRQEIYKKAATALFLFMRKRPLTRLPPDLEEEPFPLPREPKLIKKRDRQTSSENPLDE